MNGKENPLELLLMCAVMLLLSLMGIVGGLSRGLFGNMDGILVLGVCLMMALIFAILVVVLAKQQGWLGKKDEGGTSTPSASK